MGVLSLHNECPPIDYSSADAVSVAQGLLTGEAATSATLRAVADCISALAHLDDTVAAVIAAWRDLMSGGPPDPAALAARTGEVHAHFTATFEAIETTADRLDHAVAQYRELADYARQARAEGRGAPFEQALRRIGGDGFDVMVSKRVEAIRALKVRIVVLRALQDFGYQALAAHDFPTFFLQFMQPIRDVSTAVEVLYSEVVRGAKISHQAMFQVCTLAGEDAVDGALERDLDLVDATA